MSAPTSWITQQLVRFLSELSVRPHQRSSRSLTLRVGAERAAEAIEAEAVGILWEGRLAVAIGFGPDQHAAAAVRAVAKGESTEIDLSGLGPCPAVAVPFGDTVRSLDQAELGDRGHLVLARSGEGFSQEELILVRALARILSLSLRSVDAMTAERSLRLESERRAREALRDPLTGLPNRALFLDRLETAAAAAERRGRWLAVLFMDLDGFKVVNDTLGHATGDELLRAVAVRLAGATRTGDTVARLGGDEFAVLVDDLDGPSGAETVAERLCLAMQAPFRVADRDMPVGASVGIAYGPRPNEAPTSLLRDADLAMYRAKAEATGGHRVFTSEMRQALVERIELEEELRHTIGHGGLVCLYQPVVDLTTAGLLGLEALVRWRHPRRGLLPPAEFLDLARECGVIGQLDNWVLEEACRQLSGWRTSFPVARDLVMAVNVSGEQLAWEGLPAFVERNMFEWHLSAAHLIMEVSETAILGVDASYPGCLLDLKSLGVRMAIDDFGTGHSSLGRLRDLPVDIMKIDRSFVTGIDVSSRLRALTANIVQLGKDLGLDVIIEGVESAAEHDVVRAIGCLYGQGFHYGRPGPAQSIDRLLSLGSVPVDAAVSR